MYHQFYEGMTLTRLPLFALLLFFAVFVGVGAWLYLARRGGDYDALARLPLAGSGAGPSNSSGEGIPHERE